MEDLIRRIDDEKFGSGKESECEHPELVDVKMCYGASISFMMGECSSCREKVCLTEAYRQNGSPLTYVRKHKE